jgi:hypothetical protein
MTRPRVDRTGCFLHDFNRNFADSRALAYPILSELYDPGKQAKAFERQAHIRKCQRRILRIRILGARPTAKSLFA